MPNSDKTYVLSPRLRLQWQEARKIFTLLYPEGMIELNPSATEILQLCNGKNTFKDIVTYLENKYLQNNLSQEVAQFIQEIVAKGWIIERELLQNE